MRLVAEKGARILDPSLLLTTARSAKGVVV
jgi:hypothetical protein